MPTINKTEKIATRVNIAVVVVGMLLVAGLTVYVRGAGWISATAWSQVSIFRWIAIVLILGLAVATQYYAMLLLRYSIVKYLVLWLPPIFWLFMNGLVALRRLFESAAEATLLSGFIPVTDLIGWLTGAIYAPLLIGGGLMVAMVDAAGQILDQACQVVGFTGDGGGFLAGLSSSIGMFLDLLGSSFMREVVMEHQRNRAFFDFGLDGVFGFPHWLFSAGYSFTCIFG
jgi:hypothetical protein